MDIVLKVTENQLVSMADDISRQINEIEKQFAQLENEISQSRSYWEGDASDMHQEKFTGLKDDIESAVHNLKKHPQKLLEMAGLYRESERLAAAAAQSLPSDVIF